MKAKSRLSQIKKERFKPDEIETAPVGTRLLIEQLL
jgi:hypothetical protein